jgi:uncharacterized protein (DUF427 family)
MDRLQPSGHQTNCSHKGAASYWSVTGNGRTGENAAWSYERPVDSAAWLAGYIALDF